MSDEKKNRQKTAHIRDFKNRHRHNHRNRPVCMIGGGDLTKDQYKELETQILKTLKTKNFDPEFCGVKE